MAPQDYSRCIDLRLVMLQSLAICSLLFSAVLTVPCSALHLAMAPLAAATTRPACPPLQGPLLPRRARCALGGGTWRYPTSWAWG